MSDPLTDGYTEAGIAFVTPTWRGDLDRFRLLRASMSAFGLDRVPHHVVVHSEDHALFTDLPNIHLTTTADVLPAEIEQRRKRFLRRAPGRRMQIFQRSLYKRFGWCADANYYGWHTQQLIKLALGRQLDARVLITLDSDVIFTRQVPASVFVQEGRSVLYGSRYRLARHRRRPDWYGNACRLWDLPWPRRAGDASWDHVAHPFVFDVGLLRAMLDQMELRYPQPWWDTLLSQPLGQWSEFMTYGVYVHRVRRAQGVVVAPANQACRWLETAEQRQNAAAFIDAAFDDPCVRYLAVQADHHRRFTVSDYAPVVLAALARRASS